LFPGSAEQGKEIMDLQLIVLAGAKHGTRIPLKKSKFVIGRSKECTLRAGSEAVSRRHCAILRGDSGWMVRDLGSRNGTFLNDEKIAAESPLKPGDELAVGPLRFRVEEVKPQDEKQKAKQEAKSPKQPPVKDVADAVQRTASKNKDSATEEDISRWLLGISDADADAALKETRTISMEETGTLEKAGQSKQVAPQTKPAEPAEQAEQAEQAEPIPLEPESDNNVIDEKNEEEASEGSKSGSWNWLKFGKGKQKKQPGKLPKRADEDSSKDSREAAADILREMTRRH
jgi:pSer/pThr/pTyr-binding forkhead associated (FHA) protein